MKLKDILDFYSQPANFTYHNFNLYPSICGGIISLILKILLLAYLIYLIIDMSKRDVPTIYESTMYEENPSPYTVYQYDKNEDFKKEGGHFLFLFGIKNNKTNEFDDTLINNDSVKLTVELHETTPNGEEMVKNLTYSNDGKNVDFYDFVDESFKDYYYINDEYTLKGNIDFPDSAWLEITLFNTSNLYFDGNIEYQFQMYFQFRALRTKKFHKNIIEDSMMSLYYILLDNYTKEVDFPFSVNEVKTNDLFLPRYLSGKYKSKYYLYENEKTEQIKEFTNNTIFKIRIHLARESKQYIREFSNIISILAII